MLSLLRGSGLPSDVVRPGAESPPR
jgi:hypothetical protein